MLNFFTPDDIELFLRNWINFFFSRQNIKISEVNDHFFVLDSRILFGFDTLYLFPGIQSKAIQLAEESCVNSLVTSGKLHLKRRAVNFIPTNPIITTAGTSIEHQREIQFIKWLRLHVYFKHALRRVDFGS